MLSIFVVVEKNECLKRGFVYHLPKCHLVDTKFYFYFVHFKDNVYSNRKLIKGNLKNKSFPKKNDKFTCLH